MTGSRLIDVISENIQSVKIVKGFHLYTRRNEWVNWDGDTSLVRRSYKEFRCTLSEAENDAEKMRKPGTKFFIDEFPVACIRSERRMVLISELFTESPLIGYASNHPSLRNVTKLGDIASSLQTFKWSVFSNYDTSTKLTLDDGQYLTRKSSPGKGKNGLVWTLNFRKIDKAGIDKLVERFESIVAKNQGS